MPWNLLILPLVAGFIFIHWCCLFNFRASRLESERLLLESAAFGVFFATVSRILVDWIAPSAVGAFLRAAVQHYVDFPFMGTALGAVIVGVGSACGINLAAKNKRIATWLKFFIVAKFESGLLRLLYKAMDDERPVLVTLSSRKVYIGYVIGVPDKPHDHYFTLALLLSGYRASDTLDFVETQNYVDKVTNPKQLQRFAITLCMKDVVSAHPFDHDQYQSLFAPKRVLPRDVLGTFPVNPGGYIDIAARRGGGGE